MHLACSNKWRNNVLINKTYNVEYSFEIIKNKSKYTLNEKLKPPVGVSKSLLSESLRLNQIIYIVD